MNGDVHRKARRLAAQDRVEGIAAGDREWLDRHLERCAECSGFAGETDEALRSLRSFPVALPPELAGRTRLRVYLRVRDLQGQRSGQWAAWAACGVSWAVGIASAPYVWRGCEWLGHRVGLPSLMWKMGFALWWAVPALLVAGALLIERLNGERYRIR